MLALDHLVVATDDLARGTAQMTELLGTGPEGGGAHAVFGTHNALWPLGPVYLELIAIDPDASGGRRPCVFGLDRAEMAEKLRAGPALIHWVLRSDALEADLAALGHDPGPPVAMARGDLSWRLCVRADGTMPCGGVLPSMMAWDDPARRPALTLPDRGLQLEALSVQAPAERLPDLRDLPLVRAQPGAPRLSARIRRPDGEMLRL